MVKNNVPINLQNQFALSVFVYKINFNQNNFTKSHSNTHYSILIFTNKKNKYPFCSLKV